MRNWLYKSERTGEYWCRQLLGGTVWAGGYDACAVVNVFGFAAYKRVGSVIQVFGVTLV